MGRVLYIVAFFSACFYIGDLAFDDDKIFGGIPVVGAEFPYQVSIRWSENDNHFCGGSIIGPRHILTAAHCMKHEWSGYIAPILISVVAGQNVLTMNQNTVFRNASRIYVHPDFDSKTKGNDIAIIKVSEEFSLTNSINLVDYRRDKIKPRSICTIAGWGAFERDSTNLSEDLLKAEIKTIDFDDCQKQFAEINEWLLPGMMCADGFRDGTQGDSGGPLFCKGLLTGIMSTGKKSSVTTYPGVYTDISYYTRWIQYILNNEKTEL